MRTAGIILLLIVAASSSADAPTEPDTLLIENLKDGERLVIGRRGGLCVVITVGQIVPGEISETTVEPTIVTRTPTEATIQVEIYSEVPVRKEPKL